MRYIFLRYPEGKAKAVTFSYDDGCSADMRMANTLTRYNMKGTFNFNCAKLRDRNFTKEEVVENFLSKGHEIATHGAMHIANGAARPIDGIKDTLECRAELENRYGMIIRGMAYPDSGITRFSNTAEYENIKRYLTDLDIAYVRTLAGDNNSFMLPTDWHAWMPTAHHNNPDIIKYMVEFVNIDIDKIYSSSRYPRLFYVWGHSYEFDNDNNWDLLDTICETLGGKDDTWYATNMEIYNYVTAYNSLVFSVDRKIIYNPTLIDIWFDLDGKLYKIASGETLKIKEDI